MTTVINVLLGASVAFVLGAVLIGFVLGVFDEAADELDSFSQDDQRKLDEWLGV